MSTNLLQLARFSLCRIRGGLILGCFLDTNECAESGMCLNGRCVNEMGKYRCECDQDFQPNPTNTACIG